MKISIDTLVNILPQDVNMFLDMSNFSPKQLERYVGGQINKFGRLHRDVCEAQNTGKISDKESFEIHQFCKQNMDKIEIIIKNFKLFNNMKTAKPSYAEYNRRVKSLLK